MDSHSANRNQQTRPAPPPANEIGNAYSDEVFDHFVEGPGDIRGMIAYCIYRFEKKNKFENKASNQEERELFSKSCVTAKKYNSINDQASEVVGRFVDNAIKNNSRKKFFREVTVGITVGIVSALITPFVWYAVKSAIISSGATAQAEEILDHKNHQ